MKKTLIKIVKISVVAITVLFTMSCASTTKLYSWHDYQKDYYNFLKKADKNSLEKLTKTYEKIIAEQKETRGIVPPGIYADYGYLLMENGKPAEAKSMLAKEMELYPESEVFIKSILKRFE